ncbi:ADP-ribosylglycohydrolase family protein [Diplocloster modestus]|uniref:ADP-ribosylglycohydrolase family protein n=1 Tax=Diplocloster modestus TaxID=2850322 RepID=A0ABS6KEV5_9FIRM|nr:ADP-ribosylglycohydrolase family protein [Diplocloster modestus]MBU9729028.1 ADP-ribosylglycohydrolase family protein [Diplocloster modestus]
MELHKTKIHKTEPYRIEENQTEPAVLNKRIECVLEALVTGDAMGMPTEFMTRNDIKNKFKGYVDQIIDTRYSRLHRDLPTGSVTDDSEQNLILMRKYIENGEVTVEATADGLLQWIEETDACARNYIGPSARKALTDIQNGLSPYESGKTGTTCGGIMRVPSAFLACPYQEEEELTSRIRRCLIPTHNTSEALEAAGAYGFALRSAFWNADFDTVIEAALRGAGQMLEAVEEIHSAPSSAARIREVVGRSREMGETQLMDWLHDVLGCGLSSADVCGAVFAVFAKARTDVFKAICMGASMGGDTDTIAALAGALCAAFAGRHNIPAEIQNMVLETNHLDLEQLSQSVSVRHITSL